jgi:hypothetical protein
VASDNLQGSNAEPGMNTLGIRRFVPVQQMGELFLGKSRRSRAECPEDFQKNTTVNSQKRCDNPDFLLRCNGNRSVCAFA